jgi:hypothetical protein
MGRICNVCGRSGKLSEDLKGSDDLGDMDTDRRII